MPNDPAVGQAVSLSGETGSTGAISYDSSVGQAVSLSGETGSAGAISDDSSVGQAVSLSGETGSTGAISDDSSVGQAVSLSALGPNGQAESLSYETRCLLRVFVGIGSNIEPERNVLAALELLAAKTDVTAVSMFYRSAALLRPELPAFLNGVAELRTGLDAHALKFDVLRGIETALGRVRGGDSYGSRTIDLDILLYGSAIIDAPGLRVPDPDIRERAFIAVPLLELAPDLVLPGTGERLSELPCAAPRESLIAADAFTLSVRERLRL